MFNAVKYDAVKITFTAFLAATLTYGAALAEDEREFDVDNFDRIDLSAGVKLIAAVGEPQSIKVYAENGDFSDFEISVRNGALRLSRDNNLLRWHTKKSSYKVVLTTPALRSLEASSGSRAEVSNIDAPRFNIDLSSGARVSLEGMCEDCSVDLSSGANLDAKELACGSANIDVSSGGHGEISASVAIIADASSGGHMTVYGNPERVSIDKSSGGRIYVASSSQARRD